jgi:lambda family phage tail tape measure protein
MAQTTQVRQIKVVVDTKGNQDLKALSDSLKGVNQNTKSLASSFAFLKNAFVGYLTSVSIREITQIADSMQLLRDRIRVLVGGTAEAEAVMKKLVDTANRTKVGVDDLANIFARLQAATKEVGVSTGTVVDLTEVLQNSFRLSGSGAQEATSAAIQLSQGLASGQLRGQELRSVLEANVVIGDLLAKQFKVTRGELYKLAEGGQITAPKVMLALLKNADDLNGKAKELGQTFEQTLLVSLNKVKVVIGDLNEEFGGNAKFAAAVEGIGEVFATVAQRVSSTLKFYKDFAKVFDFLPDLGSTFKKVFEAIGEILIRTAFPLRTAYIRFLDIKKILYEVMIAGEEFAARFSTGKVLELTNNRIANLKKTLEDTKRTLNEIEGGAERKGFGDLRKEDDQRIQDQERRVKDLKKLQDMASKSVGKEPKIKELFAEVNKAYKEGKLSVQEYYDEIERVEKIDVERKFRDGKITLDAYSDALEVLKRKELSRELSRNAISLDQFNESIRKSEIESLTNRFKMGKISLKELDEELLKLKTELDSGVFRSGVQSYIESIGTLATNVADMVKRTFAAVEDVFIDFIKNGKIEFKEFANAILDDLLRIIIRASIIRPIAGAILNSIPAGTEGVASAGGGGNVGPSPYAFGKGGAFDGGIRKFATGGIVSKPTLFSYGSGKAGVMGEAGPEAILPLARGKGGNLGVQASVTPVTINVINNAGVEVQQKESTGPNGERSIELLIRQKVREQITNGSYDKAMQASYGVSRKGS